MNKNVSFFWFRRDLRLEDNTGLFEALNSQKNVLPVFIFDTEILENLPNDDHRVTFIYDSLERINTSLKSLGSSLLIKIGPVKEVWKQLIQEYSINAVYTNTDYEPYAIKRDLEIKNLLEQSGSELKSYKDQVIFETDQIVKNDGKPYTVYTPYKNKWLLNFDAKTQTKQSDVLKLSSNFKQIKIDFPSLKTIGFERSIIEVKPYSLSKVTDYDKTRDFPFIDATSYVSPYLRFGLISIRKLVKSALELNATYLSELIWREFFMQILFHFPKSVTQEFKPKYKAIPWRHNEAEFKQWCDGKTGYPLVDAGMRQLNQTGYMHNRVRMVVASFLCKHLLMDWRRGEAYFAEKLFDYELSSNIGNWQWASSTGCDSVPYFRIFNPTTQITRFDKELKYINKWVSDFNELTYPRPMVEHKLARERCLETFKKALS